MIFRHILLGCLILAPFSTVAAEQSSAQNEAKIDLQWGVKIPMRDKVQLNATLYRLQGQKESAPCIFTLTPYISQTYHEQGMYFAAHGYPFLTVDVRGRGNSGGEFRPMIQEARDGHDIVEWLARQPYCNGKVSMWGGSYAGYDQWVTAKEFPPHLATIVPVASPYAAVDFPMRGNIAYPYEMQWLSYVSGRAAQDKIFEDGHFWAAKFRQQYEAGTPFKDLDQVIGVPSPIFREWMAHPFVDEFWDSYNPTAAQYAMMTIPILTITGSRDDDQPGALTHYREYMRNASPAARARHFLVIGPWDHAGTRTPKAEFGGLSFGPASLVDLPKLHLDWYAWTMQQGPRPEFLKKNVAYYVMFADKWRYADSLDKITVEQRPYYLDSVANATDVLAAGSLGAVQGRGEPDHYIYDPRDLSIAVLETADGAPGGYIDQRRIYSEIGRQIIYHTTAFQKDTEISGFFKLSAWISIDQPDTDFVVSIYEIRQDGSSIFMADDLLRARYRKSLRKPELVTTKEPLRYDFDRFTFVAQQVKKGSRLRLVIAPANSIHYQKNYNSGGDVSSETMRDARPVTVKLYHDRSRPSVLYVPVGQPELPNDR